MTAAEVARRVLQEASFMDVADVEPAVEELIERLARDRERAWREAYITLKRRLCYGCLADAEALEPQE